MPFVDSDEESDTSSNNDEDLVALFSRDEDTQSEAEYAFMAGEESSDDEVTYTPLSNLNGNESDDSDSEASLEDLIKEFFRLYSMHTQTLLINKNMEEKIAQLMSQLKAATVVADTPAETVISATQEAEATDSAALVTENL